MSYFVDDIKSFDALIQNIVSSDQKNNRTVKNCFIPTRI